MDFYGFDNQDPGSPGQRFANNFWWFVAAAAAKATGDIIGAYYSSEATRDIAKINAGAQLAMARENSKTLAEITGIRTEAIHDQAELRSTAILETARLQYQQVLDQIRVTELAAGREGRNWKFQLRNDVKSLTLAASARLHADQNASVRRKTGMHYEHAARQVEGTNTNT